MIPKGQGVEKASWGGVVLCGGASSRMGRPKALLPWPSQGSASGTTLVETVVATLKEVVEQVVVVSNHHLTLPPLDARIVTDREPGLGPLGGIREGLHASDADLVYVTSTDAPYLTTEFVRAVLQAGSRPLPATGNTALATAAAAPKVDGFVQTLAAAYPRRLAAQADLLIAEGRMRPLFLLESEGYHELSEETLPDLYSLRNLNDSSAYLQGVRELGEPEEVIVECLGVAQQRAGKGTLSAPIGELGEILDEVARQCPNLVVDLAHGPFLVSLNGEVFLSDPQLPVGPGEHLVIMDAAAGG